uniref:Golgin-45 n=1 Tax=Cacopsylla melanoneura TaxID=428564 RepID=A0A8D8M6V0_9HEMI
MSSVNQHDELSKPSEMVALPTPRRTEGDGMEHTEPAQTTSTTTTSPSEVPVAMHTGKMVHLIPKNFIKNSALVVHVSKEPKYVPYEPYKAAVNPRMPCLKQKKTKVSVKKTGSKDDGNEVSIHQPVPVPQAASSQEDKEPELILDEKLKDLNISDNTLSLSDSPDLEIEIKRLRSENLELENQVKYQAQVNGELKKLLVAAVGEDIETKVNHLTEDKLHLAKALLNSAKRLNTHQEQMEWLAGQCEVWRSKFLASSLMVEELAKWKAVLTQKVCDYQDVTRKILAEHQMTHAATSKTFTNLAIIGNNFDLSVMTDPASRIQPKSSTVVDLANSSASLSASLKEQLLGSSPFPINTNVPDLARGEYLTPAEKQAYQLVNECLTLAFGKTDVACSAVMGAAGAVSGLNHSLSLYHPPCCAHCQDRKIQTI